ncbi:adaptin N terminal region-domain-containing protein [Desarmillaria tabescens]|uniref:AP-3 complex subunit delta n=1 Tax=Armillaria tabescens TaxID=1929756 RepID=A0AA39NIB7_ARMTA|nr:adaptin N terminal region-domain-containing protein [Desarmillaria tabescens]KAK0466157.1 adaptin N terminal region-domain-containing protein [Desarmillaria tabescens]
MWERTLQDLIRGLRANKKDEAKFIAKAVEEIRREIKSEDMELKAGAVLKLTYLDMLGHDMSWASFHVVEVMSSPRFHLKSVGYLAAVQSFDQDTDVLMLTTNLLKKDLISTPADIAVTLNGISHIATPDLARDLAPELIKMLSHSRPNIRKRAVVALFKAMLKYPEISTQGISKLKERLEDADPSVVAATVNVLCELARRNPQDYLTLAPVLFHLMTTSSNNWMLIKIIKLFGSLSPHEPRLVRKLQPPITELISTTSAISLLYECVHTCIIGGMLRGPSGDSLARLCVSKLATFIQDADQNLKYIALLAMVKIVPSHPYLVAEYQDTILASVSDQDISIRMRALDLVSAMVNRDNLQSIVQQVLSHLVSDTTTPIPTASQSLAQHLIPLSPQSARPHILPSQSKAYRLVLSQRILTMCSQDTYDNVTNFEWYLSVLVDLAHVANVDVGSQIRDQLVDVVGRVRAARRYAVKLMYTLLIDDTMLRNAYDEGSCSEVLWAAAWICGEYCSELAEPQKLLPYLLQPDISRLSPDIIAVYIQAATKIFGFWATEVAQRWTEDDLPEVKDLVATFISRGSEFVSSPHIEVQERAANTIQLFRFIQADLDSHHPIPETSFGEASSSFDPIAEPRFPKSLYLIQPLFSTYQLNPVGTAAQESVPVPEGLDLDAWIVPPPPKPNDELNGKVRKSKKGKEKETNGARSKKKRREGDGLLYEDVLTPAVIEETAEDRAERERRKAERLKQLKDDPYYIIEDQPTPPDDVELIPVVQLEGMPSLAEPDIVDPLIPTLRTISEVSLEPIVIDKDGEMPQGAVVKSTPPTPRNISTPSRGTPPPPTSSFAQYDVPEDDPQTSAPEPIKVTRSKKKKAGTGKKKRTQVISEQS